VDLSREDGEASIARIREKVAAAGTEHGPYYSRSRNKKDGTKGDSKKGDLRALREDTELVEGGAELKQAEIESNYGPYSRHSAHRSTPPPPDYEPDLRAYACDVTSESAVQSTFASILADFGHIDVLVTAAGIVDNVAAENYGFERWKNMFDVNVHGSFLFAREAGKYWIGAGKGGNVILVSSMSSMICVRPQKQAAYNASKGAVGMMGRSLCTEVS
jgi:NAD(P)-dependent dehydrogenase (short-subunit alcohol dehydrogenase family)